MAGVENEAAPDAIEKCEDSERGRENSTFGKWWPNLLYIPKRIRINHEQERLGNFIAYQNAAPKLRSQRYRPLSSRRKRLSISIFSEIYVFCRPRLDCEEKLMEICWWFCNRTWLTKRCLIPMEDNRADDWCSMEAKSSMPRPTPRGLLFYYFYFKFVRFFCYCTSLKFYILNAIVKFRIFLGNLKLCGSPCTRRFHWAKPKF